MRRASINARGMETFLIAFDNAQEDDSRPLRRTVGRKGTGIPTKRQVSISRDELGADAAAGGPEDSDDGSQELQRALGRKATGFLNQEQLRQLGISDEDDDDAKELEHGGGFCRSSDVQRLEVRLVDWMTRLDFLLLRLLQATPGAWPQSVGAGMPASPRRAVASAAGAGAGASTGRGVRGHGVQVLGPPLSAHLALRLGDHAKRPCWKQELASFPEPEEASTPASAEARGVGWGLHGKGDTRTPTSSKEAASTLMSSHGSSVSVFKSSIYRSLEYVTLNWLTTLAILCDVALVGAEVNHEALGSADAIGRGLCAASAALAAVFMVEVIIRATFFGRRLRIPAERWRRSFDVLVALASALGAVACFEGRSWGDAGPPILGLARALRLTRFFRLAWALPALDGLRRAALLAGRCLRHGAWLLSLVVLLTYVAAVVVTHGASAYLRPPVGGIAPAPEDEAVAHRRLGTLTRTSATLLQSMTGGLRWGEVVDTLGRIGWPYQAAFLLYLFLSFVCVVGVLNGVFLEGGLELTRRQRAGERRREDRQREADDGRRLFLLFKDATQDAAQGEDCITSMEFNRALQQPDVRAVMEELQIESPTAQRLFGLLSGSQRSISIAELVDGLKKLRGEREVRSADVEMLMLHQRKLAERLASTPMALSPRAAFGTPKFGVSKSSLSSRSSASVLGF